MIRASLLAVFSAGLAAPAIAQHAGHYMPPAPEADKAPDAHAGRMMNMEAVDPPDAGFDIPPDAPADHAADAFFAAQDMERARRILADEHGGSPNSMVMANLLEYQARDGDDGYRWEGEGWFGGDINRLVIKTEGEGDTESLESAEIQALYSRAVGPYTDVQIGIRHDLNPDPSRTFLALSVETLLPYWFEIDAGLFIGEGGQVLGRLEGSYDLRLAQRIVLEPRAELNFAAQNDAATGTGSGLSGAELGLRLRYEIRREFAPYIGVSWERSYGATADFARGAGDRVETTSFVAGLRAWY